MRLLDETRALTHLHSLSQCGARPLGGAVAVTQKGDGSGGFSGLFRCGSVWACPECAPIVRADRAGLLETWAAAWMREGHGLAMATLTSRHGQHARLGPQLERTAGAWRRMLQSRWWRKFRAKHGLVGATRALEMTHSWANSWHTHIHAVLWTEEPVSADIARAMEEELFTRWRAECAHAKLGRPTKEHGVRVDPAARGEEGAADLARYLVKVQDKDDDQAPAHALGNELLRGDMKTGRRAGRAPFEILRRAVAGDAAELELWHEYEHATKGHRMLTWAGDIKARLAELVEAEERDPAAVVTDEDARDTRAVLVQVTPEPWRTAVAAHPGRRGQLRVAVGVASAAAIESAADPETAARAAIRELLESWGLIWGRDMYGPEIDPETGELRGEYVTPQQRPERRRQEWQTADDLDAGTHLLGVRPRDAVRPEQAQRRAAGLPIARELGAETTVETAAPGDECGVCHGKLADALAPYGQHPGDCLRVDPPLAF
ncbi:protein rep [Streptomyces asiaticus]|uniref:protein rep n=1 Tax=Streptomyces asiaticus TaxID=114695 RepID=UPI003F67995E